MRCAKCDGRSDGQRCTDCAAAYVREVREHCAWDHSVLMMALSLKILERSKV
jgi:hypothetical protein